MPSQDEPIPPWLQVQQEDLESKRLRAMKHLLELDQLTAEHKALARIVELTEAKEKTMFPWEALDCSCRRCGEMFSPGPYLMMSCSRVEPKFCRACTVLRFNVASNAAREGRNWQEALDNFDAQPAPPAGHNQAGAEPGATDA